MTTTEEMGETSKQKREDENESLGDSIERMMADVEKRVKHLLQRLHNAAKGSEAFEGGERDVKRLVDWMDAKAHELRKELDHLAKDASHAAMNVKDSVKESVSPKHHDNPPASHSNSPEEKPTGDGD